MQSLFTQNHIKTNVQHSLFVPDYDFQTALMEALCRMASPDQRKELADRWFTMQHVANAFVKIHDSEFETVKTCCLSHACTFVALQWLCSVIILQL